MEQYKTFFLKRVPDRLSNIVKGLAVIVVSIPLAFFSYFFIVLIPNGGIFVGDVPNPNDAVFGWLSVIVSRGIIILALAIGIYMVVKPVRKTLN